MKLFNASLGMHKTDCASLHILFFLSRDETSLAINCFSLLYLLRLYLSLIARHTVAPNTKAALAFFVNESCPISRATFFFDVDVFFLLIGGAENASCTFQIFFSQPQGLSQGT